MNTSSGPAVNHHANYSGCAGVAGLLAGIVMLLGGRRRARLAAELAGISRTDNLVDIGCGPGNAVRAAARRGARVTGVDPSAAMLRLARALARRRPSVTWSRGSAEQLPAPDDSATVAWSLATVHHWKDVAAGLAEVRRVLAADGRLLVIERRVEPGATGLASHGWTEQQVQCFADLCRQAGFETVRIGERTLGRRVLWVVQADGNSAG